MMRKRLVSLVTVLAVLLPLLPGTALAAQGPDGLCAHHTAHTADCGYAAPVEEIPCDKGCTELDETGAIIHDSDCAYTPASDGTPCGYVCEICAAEGSKDPEEPEDDPVRCPHGTDEEDCPIRPVEALIAALPTVDALAELDTEGRNAVSDQLNDAYDAYKALTDAEQAQVEGADAFDALFAFFNSLTMPQAENGVITTPLDFTNVGNGAGQTPAEGNGYKWSGDRESGYTLKLNGLKMNISGIPTSYNAITLPQDGDITITVTGENSIAASSPTESYATGIYHDFEQTLNKVVTLTGGGTLEIHTGRTMIEMNSSLVIKDVTITGSGKGGGIGSFGGDIKIENANITLDSDGNAMATLNAFYGKLEVINSELNVSSASSNALNAATELIISGGRVNATNYNTNGGPAIACRGTIGTITFQDGAEVTAINTAETDRSLAIAASGAIHFGDNARVSASAYTQSILPVSTLTMADTATLILPEDVTVNSLLAMKIPSTDKLFIGANKASWDGANLVLHKGDVSSTGLDLSDSAPAVPTLYTAGAGTILWEPELTEGVLTGGTLTLTDAVIDIPESFPLRLPRAIPVTIDVNGTNTLRAVAAGMEDAYAIYQYGGGEAEITITSASGGTLALFAQSRSQYCAALTNQDGGALHITGNVSVTATGEGSSMAAGVQVNGPVTVDGGARLAAAGRGIDVAAMRLDDPAFDGVAMLPADEDGYRFEVHGSHVLPGIFNVRSLAPAVGTLTIPDGSALTIPSGRSVLVTDALRGAIDNQGTLINNGLIIVSTDAGDLAAQIRELGITGDGLIVVGSEGIERVYNNAGAPVSAVTAPMDFTKSADHGGWKADATLDADGYTWDNGTKTLTLKNFVQFSTSEENTDTALILPDGVTLRLEPGSVNVVSTFDGAACIQCDNLTISGGGTLRLYGRNAFQSDRDLTIQDSTVDANGCDEGIY